MVWNKLKQQLESFLSPSLKGKVAYLPSGYRYTKEKQARSFIVVLGREVFKKTLETDGIHWYQAEQEIIRDAGVVISVTLDEVEAIKHGSKNNIPEDRLIVVAKKQKATENAKKVFKAQTQLLKTDFEQAATVFLSTSIENSLASDEILLNVLAVLDRRVGKKRLYGMEALMRMKHPLVQYFYDLRCHPD